MTANLSPAFALETEASAVRPRRLRAMRALLFILLPYVALLWIRAAFSTLPPAVSSVIAVVGLATALALLWRRESPYALWPGYLLFLQLHATTWARLPALEMPLRVHYVVEADRLLGLGELPTITLQRLAGSSVPALDVAAFAVYASFFVAPIILFLAAWRAEQTVARVFTRAVAIASVVSLLVMAVLPTAPPWMASDLGVIAPVERIAVRVAGASVHSAAGAAIGVNEVAAMPSMHMGTTVLIALAILSLAPQARRWAWLYPAAMGCALVYLGEHYLVDVIAGLAVGLVAWRLAWVEVGPFAPRRAAPRVLDGADWMESTARAA